MFIKIILFTKVAATCKCSTYMSEEGFGNCGKDYLHKGPVCYVTMHSNCKDKTLSTLTKKYYSWDACNSKKITIS